MSYDERSDRRQTIAELTALGYEDAYRQFIEPGRRRAATSSNAVKPRVRAAAGAAAVHAF